jgi:5-(carboxyamino)imidazole ribonucleotide synthase
MNTPDTLIGIIGGGQLGRMFCMEARRMGFRTLVWTGGVEAPARIVADEILHEPFDSREALAEFTSEVEVASVEFENIPVDTLAAVAEKIALHPSPEIVGICQNREREKTFLRTNGIPCAAFEVVTSAAELASGLRRVGTPAVLKTAAFGYDGKGQVKISPDDDPEAIWRAFDAPRGVLEQFIDFERELSVMVAGDGRGHFETYDPAENRHRHHVLDVSIVPARVDATIAVDARALARRVAEALGYRGILGVEFFQLADGSLLVNEMAPRPHNSGHHTLDACVTSQFEQQIRAICGLPLGSTRLLSPVVMLNLLGDMWSEGTHAPDWEPVFADRCAALHLYGKHHARGRRKMGHVNFLGDDLEDCLRRAETLKRTYGITGD